MGGGLAENGINNCSEIPSSGTATVTDDGGTFVMTFGTASLSLPTHFPANGDGSRAMNKRVEVTRDDVDFMIGEFQCEAGDTRQAGYIRMGADDDGREFETYFAFDSSDSSAYVDFFMVQGSSEKLATRFSTADGDSFSLYLTRAATTGNANMGLAGVSSTGKAQLDMILGQSSSNDQLVVAGATSSECLEISDDGTSDATSTGCPTLDELTTGSSIISESSGDDQFTINDVNNMSLSTISF